MNNNEITFICELNKDHFANPILLELSQNCNINKTISNSRFQYFLSRFNTQTYWVEWATNSAIFISKYKKKHQKLFIRLHRYEMYKNKFIKKIRWDNVDRVIFVNSELEKEFKTIVPNCETITIPNAVDMNSFPLTTRNSDNSLLSYGYQFHPIKGYLNLIKIFHEIVALNDSFTLTIAGKNPEDDLYKKHLDECLELIKKFNLENHINMKKLDISINELSEHKNINNLLHSHNGIISYSLEESFHYAFAEGLSSGLQGFCNGWRRLNPKEFWGNWCYDNEESMIKGLLDWSNINSQKRNDIAVNNREYIKNNYSSQIIANLYLNLFNQK